MTKPTPIIIWGASGHARAVTEVAIQLDVPIACYMDDAGRLDTFDGKPVIHDDQTLRNQLTTGVTRIVIAVGDCTARLKLAQRAISLGFTLTTLVHPRATVASSASLGGGTVVMAGGVVGANATVGDNVIINTGATLDHDCRVGEGVHLAPGVHVAGSVTIGRRTMLGVGSSVIEHIHIGSDVLLGAGSVVIRDIPDHVVAFGVPARVIRPIS